MEVAEKFLAMDEDERGVWLRSRSEAERAALFESLVNCDKMTLMDALKMDERFRIEIKRFLLGDPKKGIPAPGNFRSFGIKAKKDVSIQIGTKNNKRIFASLKKGQTKQLPPKEAMLFLEEFGPTAANDFNRGKVEEVAE